MKKLFLLVPFLIACGTEPGLDGKEEAQVEEAQAQENEQQNTGPIVSSRHQGTYDGTPFSGKVTDTYYSGGDFYFKYQGRSTIEGTGIDAMTVFSAYNGTLHSPEFDVGQEWSYVNTGFTQEGPVLTVLGCLVLTDSGNPYYDERADVVDIQVLDVDDHYKEVVYVGRWTDDLEQETQRVTGSIIVEKN